MVTVISFVRYCVSNLRFVVFGQSTEEELLNACSNDDLATVMIAIETNKLDVNCVDVSLSSPISLPP